MKINVCYSAARCVLLLLGLSSCMRYQYATVGSDLKQTKNKEFILENDSAKVIYSFRGQDCPVTLLIANKLTTPLYINWRMSSIIIDGRSFSYWRDHTVLDGQLSGLEIDWTNSFSTSEATLHGDLSRPDPVSFIPPRTFIEISGLSLRDEFLATTKPGKMVEINTTRERVYSFSKTDSPFQYRSYLTLSYQEDFKTSFTMTADFWVTEFFSSLEGPEAFPVKTSKGNMFYTKKASGFGVTMAALGIIGFTIITVAADQ